MAAKRRPPFLLLSAAIFLAILLILYLFWGYQTAAIFALPSFFLAFAVFLSSRGFNIPQSLAYMRIVPLPKNASGWVPVAKWAAFAFFASCILTWLVSALLFAFGLLDSHLVEAKLSLLTAPALIIAFTLSPVAEEALFRGYLFRRIAQGLGGGMRPLVASAILSSLIFSALHFAYGSFAELAVAFAVGLVLCYATHKSGSLLPAIIAHASFNFLSILLLVLQ